jgi:hypothetical protein
MTHMKTTQRRRRRNEPHNGLSSNLVTSLLQMGVSTLRQQAGSEARHLTDVIREQGTRYLQERKSRAADELARIGDAVQGTADKLHDEQIDSLAEYVESAARGFERAAQFLQQRELSDVGQELQRLARRQPALTMAAMFVTGLAVGRFLKSGLSHR